MSLCINPYCLEPDHTGNDSNRFCQSCGSELVLQGRYRVLRLISDKSGFGKVYEAYERSLPKILKVLKEHYSGNQKAVELFQQEAIVLGHLHHPGIPHIEPQGYFQFFARESSQPLHCIIMEKIDGPNLQEWMKQQGNHPIGEQQALKWLQQITTVLDLVHQSNYFHRDIKPENIMLRSNGQLVLVDFGAAREMTYTYLAQLGAASSGVTKISSAGYTPPEQEQGQAVPQSDFFALGRTFIYLLTGKSPTDPSVYDPLNNEFCWRQYAPHVSPQLADLIDWLTAVKVADRPKHTQEILAAIAHFSQASSITSATPLPVPSPHISDIPLAAPATSIGVSTVAQPKTSATFSSAQQRWLWGGIAVLALGLGSYGFWHSQQAQSPIQRVTATETLSSHTSKVNTLALNPNGQTLVSGSSDNTLRIWELPTGELLQTLEGHESFINAVVVSPDGSTLISGGADKTVRLWHASTGDLESILKGHQSFVNTVAVSPNGRAIASGSADGEIRIWDFPEGTLIQSLVGHTSAVNDIVFSHSGQYLISGGADGTIKVWDMASGQLNRQIQAEASPVNTLVISPDGRTLISGNADANIRLWNIQTGELITTLSGHTSYVNFLQLSDDGNLLASSGADQTVKVWDLSQKQLVRTLTGFGTPVNDFVLDANWQNLITSGETKDITIWELPD